MAIRQTKSRSVNERATPRLGAAGHLDLVALLDDLEVLRIPDLQVDDVAARSLERDDAVLRVHSDDVGKRANLGADRAGGALARLRSRRRGVLVGLTSAGKRTVDGAFETLLASERDLLSELNAAERRELVALLKRLMKPLRD